VVIRGPRFVSRVEHDDQLSDRRQVDRLIEFNTLETSRRRRGAGRRGEKEIVMITKMSRMRCDSRVDHSRPLSRFFSGRDDVLQWKNRLFQGGSCSLWLTSERDDAGVCTEVIERTPSCEVATTWNVKGIFVVRGSIGYLRIYSSLASRT
jgi:hypothetical protein